MNAAAVRRRIVVLFAAVIVLAAAAIFLRPGGGGHPPPDRPADPRWISPARLPDRAPPRTPFFASDPGPKPGEGATAPAAASGPIPPKGPRGDIVLRVLAAEDREPLAGAEIRGWSFEGKSDGRGEEVPALEGDPPGTVRLRGCPVLPHEIVVVAPGRAPGTVRVQVEEGTEVRGPDALLEMEARIHVRVLDVEGKPRVGVEVKISKGFGFRGTLAEGETNEEGDLEFGNLPSGFLLVSLRRGRGDQSYFVSATADQTLPLVIGGPPRLEITVEDAGEKSLGHAVLLPLSPPVDILHVLSDPGENVPPGTRVMDFPEEGKRALSVGSLPPGRWFVGVENLRAVAVVEIPEGPAVPVRCVLRPVKIEVRVRRTGAGLDAPAYLTALPEGDAEKALAGDAEAMLRVFLVLRENTHVPPHTLDTTVEVIAGGPGPQSVFAVADRLVAAGPVIAGGGAPPAVLDVAPAARLRVRLREGAEGRLDQHLVAALDASGRVAGLAHGSGDVAFHLPAGRWRIELRGPKGLRKSGEVTMPSSGEEELVFE